MNTLLAVTLVLAGNRNIFKYVEDPPKRAIARPAAPAAAIVETPAHLPEPRAEVVQVVTTFDFPFRYIGSFGPEENLIAVLAGDGEIVTVRAGDAFGPFLVRDVAFGRVVIASGTLEKSVELAQ